MAMFRFIMNIIKVGKQKANNKGWIEMVIIKYCLHQCFQI